MLINENYLEVMRSKFYAYLYKIDNQEEVQNILNELKLKHKSLRHMPYAYVINQVASKSDDKEVGNIGYGLYNLLNINKLNSHLLVVVRFYGGINLGASNLSRTYLKCASKCINK